MQTMYPAFVNSPETVTLGAISPTATTVTVQDITKIPEPPNLLVIGGDRPDAETVLLTAVSGSTLTIQRAVNGSARTWADRTTIARNFTAYDHDAFKANIEALKTEKLDTDGNGSNVTAAFSQAATKANISTGEKLSVIFGKLMKWYASFGAAAWMGTGTTSSTVALGNHTHTAAAVGAVPTSRTVNGKALSADVALAAPDVGARAGDWFPTLPDVGGSRENILINTDFRNLINQKGLSSYVSSSGILRTIDMWQLTAAGTVTLNSDGTITISANGGVAVGFVQYIEQILEGAHTQSVLVTAITGSVQIYAQDTTNFARPYDKTITSTGITSATGVLSGNYRYRCGLVLSAGASITIKAIKLEKGEGQTLAHQDSQGNWVLNDTPPKPQQECETTQRQYINYPGDTSIPITMYDTNYIWATVFLPTALRAVPALVSGNIKVFQQPALTSEVTGFTTEFFLKGNALVVRLYKASHGYNGYNMCVRMNNAAFSAEM